MPTSPLRIPSPFLAMALLATVLVLAACRSSTAPQPTTRVVVGTLASPLIGALQVPDTVTVGVPFEAAVRTQGNACIQAAGGEATVVGLVATLTPYDRVYGDVCADILVAPSRPVLVRFDAPGTATVRAVGAHGTTAERTVLVRPPR